MARLEKVAPRLLRSGEKLATAPRKNLYFEGALQEEVLDYFVWRGNVERYTMLDGSEARGSSDVIKDVLRRKYLADTLDETLLSRFSTWRRKQYSRARALESGVPELPRRAQLAASDSTIETKREHFTTAAYGVSRIFRCAIWDRQGGTCAKCSRKDSLLEVHRKIVGQQPSQTSASFVALCSPCHLSEHDFSSTRGRPPSRQSIISCLT